MPFFLLCGAEVGSLSEPDDGLFRHDGFVARGNEIQRGQWCLFLVVHRIVRVRGLEQVSRPDSEEERLDVRPVVRQMCVMYFPREQRRSRETCPAGGREWFVETAFDLLSVRELLLLVLAEHVHIARGSHVILYCAGRRRNGWMDVWMDGMYNS